MFPKHMPGDFVESYRNPNKIREFKKRRDQTFAQTHWPSFLVPVPRDAAAKRGGRRHRLWPHFAQNGEDGEIIKKESKPIV